MLNEADFLEWAQAYRRWHSSDYRPWREHRLQSIPKFKDIPVGKLTEEEVDKLRGFVGKGTKTSQQLLKKPGQRTQSEMAFIADVSFLAAAIQHLDDYRAKMAGATPAAPVPEAKTDSQIAKEPSEALAPVNNNGEIVGKDFFTTANKFIDYVLDQRHQLVERARTLAEISEEIRRAQELERLADAIGISKEAAIQATAYECDARYERSKLIEVMRERKLIRQGRGKKEGIPLEEILASKNDRNWNATLTKLDPDEYQKRLSEGLELKSLSEKTFRPKKNNAATSGTSKKTPKPRLPRDRLLDLCVDMRDNIGSYPTEGEYFERFVRDKVLMENFMKVAGKLKDFVVKLAMAGLRDQLDARAHERAMNEPSAEPADFP